MLPKMSDVEIVEKTIAQLNDKRDRATKRVQEITGERQQLGYSVHAENDTKAKGRLATLNAEMAAMAGEIESVDGALIEAGKRLAAARQAVEREAARTNAAEIKELLTVFATVAQDLDESLADFVTSSHEMRDIVNKLHNLGCQFPNHNQIESLGSRAVLTAIGQSIFKRSVETLAPSERRTFSPMVANWISNISNTHIKPLLDPELGEQTNSRDAA
jgi:hypothetical protein